MNTHNICLYGELKKITVNILFVPLVFSTQRRNKSHYRWNEYLNRNVPKFSDRQVWANSADRDQTASRGAPLSGSTLFAIPSASFGCITLRKRQLAQLLG